ncbi:hypothetical protein V1291_000817 [Nitrobacteraceae bacterium AZCC 1564]
MTIHARWAISILLFVLLFPTAVSACPSGQSRGALGWCYPNVGGTPGQAAQAAKKGDLNGLAKALGDTSIAATCPACALAGKAILSKNDQALVSTALGRGLILAGAGVPPTLVTFDAAKNVWETIQIRSKQAPIPAPATPSRAKKIYKVTTLAACIVQAPDSKIVAGWVTAPALIDVETGKPYVFPNLDLVEKDVVHVIGNPCPEGSVSPGSKPLTSATLAYTESSTIPGPDERMKFFMIGTPIGAPGSQISKK